MRVSVIIPTHNEAQAIARVLADLPSDLTIPTRMISRIERELAEREKPDA